MKKKKFGIIFTVKYEELKVVRLPSDIDRCRTATSARLRHCCDCHLSPKLLWSPRGHCNRFESKNNVHRCIYIYNFFFISYQRIYQRDYTGLSTLLSGLAKHWANRSSADDWGSTSSMSESLEQSSSSS